MKRLKFSHNYPKLWGQETAELLAVKPIKIDNATSKELLKYDTFIGYEHIKNDGGHLEKIVEHYYELKPGNYVQLIFLGNFGIPFCTIRSKSGRYGDKEAYYRNLIGEIFKIEVQK